MFIVGILFSISTIYKVDFLELIKRKWAGFSDIKTKVGAGNLIKRKWAGFIVYKCKQGFGLEKLKREKQK